MVKKSLFWVCRVLVWLVSIIVVVTLITALIIQFFILPNIGQYKDKIAEFASKSAKQKIKIGNIKADWQGVNPHLTLFNIDIYDSQNRPALQLTNTEATLSWLSIPLMEPHLAELLIHAPELTIRRIASGEIFVAGISMNTASKPDLPNWLLRQTKVEVFNAKVVWLDEMRGAPALSLDKLNLQIYSPPWKSIVKNHKFTLSALPSTGTNNPIVFDGSVYGNDVSLIKKWHGSVSVSVKNANIAAFKPWFDYPIDVKSGVSSTKTVVEFANSQINSLASNLDMSNVQLQLNSDPNNTAENIVINKLTAKLNWQSESLFSASQKVSRFNVQDLTLVTNNGLNLQNALASYTTKADGNKSFELKLAHINLAALYPYVVQLPIPADDLQKIIGLSPNGNLNDLSFNWEGTKEITKNYELSTKFTDLSITAFNKIPGFNHINGEILANQNSGKLKLQATNAQLEFKDVLRWPIPANKLDGTVTWKNTWENASAFGNQAKQTEIKVSNLVMSNPHLSGTVNATYLMDGIKGGQLDLKGKFAKGNAKYAPFYYPISLGTTTLHWLDTSILAGRVEDVNLIVKGHLDDFPFTNSNNKLDPNIGTFRVTARINDSVIEYGSGWPLVEGLSLAMVFEGKRMELNANTGHVLGNQIIKSKTTIEQLDADDPYINIVSEVKGSVSEGIKFVNNSPVVELTQGFTEDLKTVGLGKLNLSLNIPMNDIDKVKYKGLYQITNGTMESESIPPLSHINGLLEFSETNLSAKNIKATTYGVPAVFNLTSGKDKSIRVTAKGSITDDIIKQNTINQSWAKTANYISGNVDWVGDILIQKPRITVGIRADLFGITSKLPAPLDKVARDHINLIIDKKQDAISDTININYGNKINAKIVRLLDGGKRLLDHASVRFNTITSDINTAADSNNAINVPKGIYVHGSLDYLDADAWRNVVQDFSTSTANKQDVTLPIQKIALKINALDIFDRRINQLKISNKPNKDGLQATIQSREISGDLQWLSQNNGKLIARLSNFTIPESSPNRNKTDTQNITKDTVKLNQIYPALDITADNFEFDKRSLGDLELIAFPQEDNWSIQKLKLTTPESTLAADGTWNKWVRNPNTRLNLNWNIKDLGKALKRFGHPDTIKGGEGELSGQLNWVGSPHEFDTTALNGNLQFEVRKGQILKVQPGVGRLFGLLSLQSLPRRLSLDFRDLFSNGFSFDKINATVKIDRGVMSSDNFAMTGPAADVTIKGEANIQKETQQLFVKVIPHISDSLSLAALAGGPLAGAVAFLAQKILKDPFNKIASTEYEIVGTWDNPQEVKKSDTNKDKKSDNAPNTPLN